MPFADDLRIGHPLPAAPDVTIDAGVAAQYQSIVGDPLSLALSSPLARRVTGFERLVNPSLTLQIAIGQSTVATRRVIANLFYRDVILEAQLEIGATLRTIVTPVARQATRSSGRAKVLLDIRCSDERDAPVANFQRLALLPVRDPASMRDVGDIGVADSDLPLERFEPKLPREWDLECLADYATPLVGVHIRDSMVDVVTSALELVRLTQNAALAHRDAAMGQGGRRLVYGGHVVGLAQASLVRMFPSVITVLGWRSCDHLAPVFENETLRHEANVRDVYPTAQGTIVGMRCRSFAHRGSDESTQVLDWQPVVLVKGDQ
jgi:2-methylfumaryl-CoA hydratase